MTFSPRLYLLPALAAGATIACSDATAPRAEMHAAGRIAATHEATVAMGAIVKRTTPLFQNEVGSTLVTPRGGWLYLPQSGLILYFPDGAVTSDVQVTATAYTGNKVVYDFQPHGIRFERPIYVAQMLLNTELGSLRTKRNRPPVWGGYLSHGLADVTEDGTGFFAEVFDGFYGGRGADAFAVFTTNHFSGYALASGRQGRPANAETAGL